MASNQACEGSSKLHVTILASEWDASNGVYSTTIRELGIQLAKQEGRVNVKFFLLKCSERDKRAAQSYGISIFPVERVADFKEVECPSSPPDYLRMDVVVGHGVKLGRQAQKICKLLKCKWVQLVYNDPEEMRTFKHNRNMDVRELCQEADFVVAIGPKLTETFRTYLSWCKKREDVFEFTPGIFADFKPLEQDNENRRHHSVLVFGHGDAENFDLKDFDVVGKSVAEMPDTRLMFIGAHETIDKVAMHFEDLGIPSNRLKVRAYMESQEYLKLLFGEADLLLMPITTEGFGIISLKAISAGLPVIVSKDSGFGESLSSIPFGSMFFLDSECIKDTSAWKMAIKEVWNKDRKIRLFEVRMLRHLYDQSYSWPLQCKRLIDKMIRLCDGMNSIIDSNSLLINFFLLIFI